MRYITIIRLFIFSILLLAFLFLFQYIRRFKAWKCEESLLILEDDKNLKS
jgi:hypothetical protein